PPSLPNAGNLAMQITVCRFRTLLAGALVAGSFVFVAGHTFAADATTEKGDVELLNVACDPTRELWQDLNLRFAADYEKRTGRKVTIKQSHGGSSSQARAVNDGLQADIVSLAMWQDTDLIRRGGLIAAGW